MAHFIYEYSANLDEQLLDLPGLMAKMHAAAADSGTFPLAGLRSRAMRCEHFRVADGNPHNGFINLSIKVGRGRDAATRLRVGELFWQLLLDHLQPLLQQQRVACSFELRELDELVKFNQRNFDQNP